MTDSGLAGIQEILDQYSPYFNEMGRSLVRVGVVFAVGFGVGAIYYQHILLFFMKFFNLEGINLVLTSPYQFLEFSIKTGLGIGFIVSFPFLLHGILRFIKPALAPKEYRLILRLLPISIGLFVTGFVFGIWVVQYVIQLFSETASGFKVDNIWDLSGFFSQVLTAGISLAVVFQLPIALTLALKVGLITAADVKQKRRAIYTFLLVTAALLSPGADLVSFAIFGIVTLFLFEVSLILNNTT